jgi:hypothetical protein
MPVVFNAKKLKVIRQTGLHIFSFQVLFETLLLQLNQSTFQFTLPPDKHVVEVGIIVDNPPER